MKVIVSCLLMLAGLACLGALAARTAGSSAESRWAALTLHNGAAITPEGNLRLDAARRQYATLPAPPALDVRGGIRLEARVRLMQQAAGQHVLGRRGLASLYVDSQNLVRAMLWTDEGPRTIVAQQPLSLNNWHTLALDYRPFGYLNLIIDGAVAARDTAWGALKAPDGDLIAGRWDWEEDGKPCSSYLLGEYSEIKVGPPQEKPRLPGDPAPRLAQHFSWGDMILFGQADTRGKIRETLERAKARGVYAAHWRVDDYVLRTWHRFCPEDLQAEYIRKYRKIIDSVYEQFDPTLEAVRVGRELGMKVYGWLCIFDEGAPPTVKYGDATPFPWQSAFTIAHPECCVVDRQGAPQWGVMEYAYPEVRRYKVEQILAVQSRFNLDGVFISTRSHSEPALQGDRFGFNDPVVQEFKRRYGKDIRTEEFDREAWRRLRGEYLTRFLRELRQAFPRDRRISIGVPRGDYFGPPYGNLFIDWRTWVSEKLVDELVAGEITGVRGLYPKRKVYEGYLCDQEAGLNVPPIVEDVENKYGPPCKAAGVELYVQGLSPLAPAALPLLDKGLTGVRF